MTDDERAERLAILAAAGGDAEVAEIVWRTLLERRRARGMASPARSS